MIPRLVSPTARMRPWLLRASGCWTCREIDLLLARLTVREVMTTSVLVVDPDRSAAETARIMMDDNIGALGS